MKKPNVMVPGWPVLNMLDAQIAVLNEAGDIVAVNASWQDFAERNGGDSDASGVGANYFAACDWGEPDQYARAARTGLAGVLDGSLPEFLMEYPSHSPGRERWSRMRVRPLQVGGGTGAVVTHADVTSKFNAESRLRQEHRRYTSLLRHADALVMVLDLDGVIIYKSPAFDSIVTSFNQEPGSTDAFAFVSGDGVEILRQALAETATLTSGTLCHELRVHHQDGSWRWIEATFTNLLDDPDVGGIVVSARDVTERKAAEADIAQRAESFSTLFHATAEAMLIHDGTEFVAVNQAYADQIGLEPAELVGRRILDFVAPASRELVVEKARQRTELSYDLVALRADGSPLLVESLGRQIQYEGRPLRLISLRDVTRQRAEEDALRASEARQALLLHLATTLREMRDPDRMLQVVSEALGRYLGTHRVEFYNLVDEVIVFDHSGWTDGTLPLLRETVAMERADSWYATQLRAGNILTIRDFHNDPGAANTSYSIHRSRAGIAVPLRRNGQWSAGLVVGHTSVRDWTEEEVALVRDVAEQTWDAVERGRAETALRESEARFRALVQESSDVVIVFKANGGLRYASPSLERVLGHPVDVYAESLRLDLVHHDDQDAVARCWASVFETPGIGTRVAYRTLNADGAWVWLDAHVTNLLHMPEVKGIVMNARDVTEQKRLESELRHLALHDPLTGLPNRTLLADRMDQALRRAAYDEKRVGLLFVDLDYFKQVNDAFGHEVGDGLLHAVAERLQSVTQVGETVARLGGDEFVVLLPMISDALQAVERAEQVQAVMASPFNSHGREVKCGVTIGIAVSEPGLLQADSLLRDGDAALFRAKQTGRGQFVLHESTMAENAMRRWRLKTDVGEAAGRGELVMHYQPIVALSSGCVTGMEALLRWQHPVYGLISPDEFIPLAEEAGQIVALGRWGVTQVCETLWQWGSDAPSIALNLSATQFSDPGLVGDIAVQLARTEIDSGKLRLEITEQITIEDLGGTIATLTQLRNLGVGVSIDDFGSGYSSLRYLRELPVSDVKLDRSFMRGLETDPGAQAMVSGVVSLAHAIGLTVTAEGIETAGQLALVHATGCDHGQGFYLARPAPVSTGDPIPCVDVSTTPPWTSDESSDPA